MGKWEIHPVLKPLQTWLNRAQPGAEQDAKEFCPLPPLWTANLRQRLKVWPDPAPQALAVQKRLAEAIAAWQTNPVAPNSLVLLTTPVDDADALLADVAQSGLPADVRIWSPLTWRHRPANPLTIVEQLKQALAELQAKEPEVDPEDGAALAERQVVVILPPLEQCFLRCIGGWQGIEWLRDTVGQQSHYFWLIPCNLWAWSFLNRVCQVEAYFSAQMVLPKLDGAALSDWLLPFAATLQAPTSPVDPEAPEKLFSQDWAWGNLADVTHRSPTVAKALWLQSLRLSREDLPDEVLPLADDEPVPVPLTQVSPARPPLPNLEPEDHYVLHALMLHGTISRAHLALTLGQGESLVQVRVQMLRQAGLVQVDEVGLSIRPIHYPRLCDELSNNNFLTPEV